MLLRVVAGDDPVGSPLAMDALETMDVPGAWPQTLEGLSEALASNDPVTRRVAARILVRRHERGSAEAFPVLERFLLDDDEDIVSRAEAALASSGGLDAEVFDARVLQHLAPGKPAAVRLAACRTAGDLGPPARKAIPALVEAARGEDPAVAAAAIEALASISPGESIPLSIQALEHESRAVRDAAITALWAAGSAAAPALPALRKLAEDSRDLDLATRATALARRLEAGAGQGVPR